MTAADGSWIFFGNPAYERAASEEAAEQKQDPKGARKPPAVHCAAFGFRLSHK